MIFPPGSIWGALNDAANQNVWTLVGSGAPVDGASGTGVNLAGKGSTYTNTATGIRYVNTGTKASPTWTTGYSGALLSGKIILGNASNVGTAVTPTGDVTITNAGVTAIGANKVLSTMLAANTLQRATGSISAANIIGTSAGQFGHASGVVLVAPQGAHKVVELISVMMAYDFATAAYTGGGNITVNNAAGGAALTGLVSAANSVGAGSDKVLIFVPLTTVAIPAVENGGLNLVSSGAFTNPGTAAGIIQWVCNYRVVDTSLD